QEDRHAAYLGRVVLGGSKWPCGGSHRQKWRCEIQGQGGRPRQNRRWSTTPARIAEFDDAAARVGVRGHGRDLVPSSAMAMLQLDARAARGPPSSHLAMLEPAAQKKAASGYEAARSACGSGRIKPRRRSGR